MLLIYPNQTFLLELSNVRFHFDNLMSAPINFDYVLGIFLNLIAIQDKFQNKYCFVQPEIFHF
jgi:hypothetical protein